MLTSIPYLVKQLEIGVNTGFINGRSIFIYYGFLFGTSLGFSLIWDLGYWNWLTNIKWNASAVFFNPYFGGFIIKKN